MPSRKSNPSAVATNNTVKLPDSLQQRVRRAMEAEGFTVWSEFCRVALTEKCAAIEDRLRAREAGDYPRRHGHGEPSGRPKTNGESAARVKASPRSA